MASNAAAEDSPIDGSQKSAAVLSSQQQSPRNASAAGTVAAAGVVGAAGLVSPSSAGGNNGNNCPYVQMGSIEVPKALQDGEKFIKWDEVSLAGGVWRRRKRNWSV